MEITNLEMESLKAAQANIKHIIQRMDNFSMPMNNVNEGNTCDHFIVPFFKAFGWCTDFICWSSQHRIEGTNKHVDYAFSKNGHGWAYVEAKRIRYKNN